MAQGCMQGTGWVEEERRKIAVGNRYREKEKARNIGRSLVKELSSERRSLKCFMVCGEERAGVVERPALHGGVWGFVV